MPPPENGQVPDRPPGNEGEGRYGSHRFPGRYPEEHESAPALDVPSFVGRGFAFPMGVGTDGGIRLTRGPEDLDASMRVILSTAPGERLMRPQFGCQIWDLLFEPVNFNTLGLMEVATREAIAQWEPRVEVEDIRVCSGCPGCFCCRYTRSLTRSEPPTTGATSFTRFM